MAIAALVLGIVGLVLSCIPCTGPFGLLLTIPGIVFGVLGIKKAKTTNQGKGASIAGLVCGIIGSLIATYWIFVWVFVANEASKLPW